MKKTKAILITVMVCTMGSVCWGQSYWKRNYGENHFYEASAITPTPDGNFIVAGSIESIGAGGYDVYLLKITPYGDTLWTRTYGGIDNENANAITPTPDGNFIIAGQTSSFGAGGYDVYLLKIKSNGDTLWSKTYGETGDEESFAIAQTSDGNFIVAGSAESIGNSISEVYLLKINSNGDTLWRKTYKGNMGATVITSTPDGNFIAAGGNGNVHLIKITPHGDTLWTKTIGGMSYDAVNAITPTSDENFIIAGYSPSYLGSVYLMKITQNGDMLWTKRYGVSSYDVPYAIMLTYNGNFIVAGFSQGAAYILKIKPNGDTLWTRIYKESGNTWAAALTPTLDGNFIITGFGEFTNSLGGDIWFLSIIDDRYAKKDSLFTFKIPVSGDSLSHGYSPLKVPYGMTVSPGGTISWTPQTDSVYMDHVEFLVSDDLGNKDSLTFNIFINSSYNSTAMKPLSHPILSKNQSFSIMQTSPSQIKFSLPSGTTKIDIYDINGRCVQRIKPVGAQALWNGLNAAGSPVSSGRYFAKIKEGKISRLGQFTVVR